MVTPASKGSDPERGRNRGSTLCEYSIDGRRPLACQRSNQSGGRTSFDVVQGTTATVESCVILRGPWVSRAIFKSPPSRRLVLLNHAGKIVGGKDGFHHEACASSRSDPTGLFIRRVCPDCHCLVVPTSLT